MSALRVHKLKVWQPFYKEIERANKTAELRRADRDFRVGDVLMLLEFDPRMDRFTGPHLLRRIGHILNPGDPPRGLIDGFVVLSLLDDLDRAEADAIHGTATGLSASLYPVEFIKP